MSESNSDSSSAGRSETGRITSDRVYMILRRWGISEVDAMRGAKDKRLTRVAERAKAKEIV